MKSEQAKAAAQIRKHLKSTGLNCSVTSDSGSMTSSVRVKIFNQPPEIVKKVTEFADQYQYGHFSGMEDIYEYSSKVADLPQVKYVFVNNHIDDKLYQKAWDFMRPIYQGADELPKAYEDISHTGMIFDMYATNLVWRFLVGSFDEKI